MKIAGDGAMIQKVGAVAKIKNRVERKRMEMRRMKSPFRRLLEKRLREVRKQSEI